MELRARGVPAILKRQGFDFFVIDAEHGAYTPREVADLISAGLQYGICPMVRVGGPDHRQITHVLDAGAEGVFVPMASTLETVQETVRQSKYHPLGQRGQNFMCTHSHFDPPASPQEVADYVSQANKDLFTAIMIETAEAAELVDDIAAVDGVDLLYMGPRDLSASMDVGMDPSHPKVARVKDRIVSACRKHGKIPGGHLGHPDSLAGAIADGMRFISHSAAIKILDDGASGYFRQVRETLADCGRE